MNLFTYTYYSYYYFYFGKKVEWEFVCMKLQIINTEIKKDTLDPAPKMDAGFFCNTINLGH